MIRRWFALTRHEPGQTTCAANREYPGLVGMGGLSPLLWRMLLRVASGPGKSRRLTVLTFHSVLPCDDALRPDEINCDDFRALMRFVTGNFTVRPLGAALEEVRKGCLPANSVAITFDDGYRDNSHTALPILRDLGIPATFFVATGFLDGGRMWNDTLIESVRRFPGEEIVLNTLGNEPHPIASEAERYDLLVRLLRHLKRKPRDERQALVDEIADMVDAPLPDDLMMSTNDLKSLAAAGMELGGHTINHPILRLESVDEVRHQLAGSRAQLRELSGQEVNVFAYPNGRPGEDYGVREVELVREAGFRAAMTTSWGSIHAGSDFYQLPRISLWDRKPLKAGLRIAQSMHSDGQVAA